MNNIWWYTKLHSLLTDSLGFLQTKSKDLKKHYEQYLVINTISQPALGSWILKKNKTKQAKLHWLRVHQRVSFKLLVFMYNCVNGSAPKYVSSGIVFNHMHTKRNLRSTTDLTRLHIPKTKRAFGDHAFHVCSRS